MYWSEEISPEIFAYYKSDKKYTEKSHVMKSHVILHENYMFMTENYYTNII